MKTVIPVTQIEIGMFIAELDRPWLDSPFLLQGFVIEDEEQIEQIKAICQTVTMDPTHSVGKWFNVRPKVEQRALEHGPVPDEAQEIEDFLSVANQLKEGTSKRGRRVPEIDPNTGRSKLEEELLYSAPLVDEVQGILHQVRQAIDAGDKIDLGKIPELITEVEQSIARNPDAMLWLTRLKSSDQYAYNHALDVSVHMMLLSRFLGMEGGTAEQLGFAGLTQDLGKSQVASEILNKPGPLTTLEFELVKRHVANSLRLMVGQPGVTALVFDVIANHHERIDGSGYPRGLDKERLTLYAEVAGLMDTYCAMTRDRVYSPALTTQKALESIIRLRGTKFRETLVDQLVQCMGLYPIGTLVELNSGEVGLVIQQNQVRRLQPRLMIVLGPDKSIERFPRNLDLLLNPLTPNGEVYRIVRSLPPDAYGIDPKEFYLG